MSERALLTRSEVEARTGFRKSALYARIAAGTFPQPIREPGTGTVRWLESEVQAWIDAAVERWPRGGSMVGSRAESALTA